MVRMLPIVLTTLFLLLPQLTEAAEVKVEGVLKSVNPDERVMTVERKTAQGAKDLTLEVAPEAGDLEHLKEGEEVTVAYDSTLELVTKIISPEQASTAAEILVLKELGKASHPWVTQDGLTIYFSVKESPQASSLIFAAKREDAGAIFKDIRQVSLGLDSTFSENGVEGIVFLPEKGQGTLQSIKRKSSTEDFSRPALIKELGNKVLGEKDAFIMSPMLSADGLTLYCELLSKGTSYCTRRSPAAPWSKPKKLSITGNEDGNQRFPYVTEDGLWLFCTNTEIKDPESANIALYSRGDASEPFAFKGYLTAGDTPLNGEFARYVSATKELFFVKKTEGRPEVHVVRNFDPMKSVNE